MHNNSAHDTLEKKLQPPAETKNSIILNSVGNGMMLGAAPFIIAESYYRITQKVIPPAVAWINLALSGIGVAWGYVSGKKEYERLNEYHQTISNQILKQNDELQEIKQQIKALSKPAPWTQKIQPAPAPDSEISSAQR